ncbi:MAG: hypothetical protein WC655_28295, partial [Candidatus Hydrogenedentales bacterium]
MDNGEQAGRNALIAILGFIVLGILAVLVFGYGASAHSSAIGTGSVVAGAALLSGILIGFLFGIPRTLQGESGGQNDGKGGEKADAPGTWYRANTNLEQVSDWLTKIIIGVGLVEMKGIGSKLVQVSQYTAAGFGGSVAAEGFAMFLIIYFGVAGVLAGYLWTRLYMVKALRFADMQVVADVKEKLDLM